MDLRFYRSCAYPAMQALSLRLTSYTSEGENMDPDAAWRDLQEAVNTAMWGEAILKAEDLLTWLERNGFPPFITGKPVFDRIVARATCEALAHWSM